jgi:hypothetical protein
MGFCNEAGIRGRTPFKYKNSICVSDPDDGRGRAMKIETEIIACPICGGRAERQTNYSAGWLCAQHAEGRKQHPLHYPPLTVGDLRDALLGLPGNMAVETADGRAVTVAKVVLRVSGSESETLFVISHPDDDDWEAEQEEQR